MPPSVTGFAGDARERFELAGVKLPVGVGDPRHLALARAVVGRGHVDAGTDELLAIELVRVAARDALELLDRIARRDRSAPRPSRRRTARRRARTCRSSAPRAPSLPTRRPAGCSGCRLWSAACDGCARRATRARLRSFRRRDARETRTSTPSCTIRICSSSPVRVLAELRGMIEVRVDVVFEIPRAADVRWRSTVR